MCESQTLLRNLRAGHHQYIYCVSLDVFQIWMYTCMVTMDIISYIPAFADWFNFQYHTRTKRVKILHFSPGFYPILLFRNVVLLEFRETSTLYYYYKLYHYLEWCSTRFHTLQTQKLCKQCSIIPSKTDHDIAIMKQLLLKSFSYSCVPCLDHLVIVMAC